MSNIAIKGNASGTGTFTVEAPNSNTDRTLVLPDEAGTVLTSASDLSGVTGAGVPDAIDVNASAPADSLAIDSSGNVGIGTTSPARQLEIYDDGTNGQSVLAITAQNTDSSRIMFADTDDNNIGILDYAHSDNSMRFTVNNSERMRINSGGAIIWGNTTSTVSGCEFSNYGNASLDVRRYADAGNVMLFRDDTTVSGTISVSGSSCSYNTSSDYRLKENVVDMTGAITRVKSLAPKRFNWIADDTDTAVDGFIAHEAQEIVPESVTGEKDAVDADGNPDYQGIDQSKLVPLLTGALQEAIAKIETLETTVADLQTRVTALEATP